MSDAINPKHYRLHPSGIEAIEICERLNFCLGNAVKYLFRAGLKDPVLQDLQKAAWYLRRANERQPRSQQLYLDFSEQVMMVRRAEKDGSALDDVLDALYQQPGNITVAIARLEREIERLQEGK